ncbi:DUF742 domain-containing protein [Streptomyces sp. GSL17-111]|uniref:DUF742 domain-containing protein n=1 Tax=Streptomyces sp. GSL17-111 TaxID=3121596 RepID=UPI0030F41F62
MKPPPGRRLVPAYLVTGGRAAPAGRRAAGYDRLAILTRSDSTPSDGFGQEHHRLWRLLQPGPLTLVECAAHLRLPVSAAVFLAADLVESGHLLIRPPVPPAQRIDRTLVERLLVGLRALH